MHKATLMPTICLKVLPGLKTNLIKEHPSRGKEAQAGLTNSGMRYQQKHQVFSSQRSMDSMILFWMVTMRNETPQDGHEANLNETFGLGGMDRDVQSISVKSTLSRRRLCNNPEGIYRIC